MIVGRSGETRPVPWAWISAIIGALLLCTFALEPLRTTAPGYDEVAYIGAAVGMRQDGTNALNIEHPRVVKLLAIAGMDASGILDRVGPIDDLSAHSQWSLGERVLFESQASAAEVLVAARVPVLILAVLGIFVCVLTCNRYFGPWVAGIAGLTLALSPTLHAHSSMLLTDLPLGMMALALAGSALRLAETRSRGWAAASGGLAIAVVCTKFSGVILVLPIAALTLIQLLRSRQTVSPPAPASTALGWLLLVSVASAAATFWALNGLSLDPAEYRRGLSAVGTNHNDSYVPFMLGRFSPEGFFWYFPMTILLKSSLGELALCAGAITGLLMAAMRVRRAKGASNTRAAALLMFGLPSALYLIVFMLMAPNVSHRYMVPIYPLMIPFLAGLMGMAGRSLVSGLGLIVVSAGVFSAVMAQPDPWSYFNGLMGCRGPRAAGCLDESNIEWGQHINKVWPMLEPALREQDVVAIDYFGANRPEYYLPRVEKLIEADYSTPRPRI